MRSWQITRGYSKVCSGVEQSRDMRDIRRAVKEQDGTLRRRLERKKGTRFFLGQRGRRCLNEEKWILQFEMERKTRGRGVEEKKLGWLCQFLEVGLT